MGTNFYWIYEKPTGSTIINGVLIEQEQLDDMDPRIHIGKRSAAGLYCWDCKATLCTGGEEGIHTGKYEFYDRCPKCGKRHNQTFESAVSSGSSGVELGFCKPKDIKKTGVTSCSSFSFAQDPDMVKDTCSRKPNKVIIRDEYNREYTGEQFLDEVFNECPIHFTRSLGEWFC